jgi:putative membrane protein
MKQLFGMFGIALLVAVVVVMTPAFGQQKLDSKDAEFVKEISQGGMLEIKLGEQAQRMAASPEVKKFAQRLVDEHGKAHRELNSLANTRGITTPQQLDAKSKEVLDKLSGLKGADFDREYIRQMVRDHEQDVQEFQRASQNLKDADLKNWVTKTLPALNEHLRQAKEIQTKLQKQ